jgi:hypothetical protein
MATRARGRTVEPHEPRAAKAHVVKVHAPHLSMIPHPAAVMSLITLAAGQR